MKRLCALTLTLCLCMSAIAPVLATEMPPEPTAVAATTTPEPAATDAPTATPQPDETARPAVTPEPPATDAPTATPQPDETAQPTATPDPLATDAPTATPQPDETAQPTVTPEPPATDAPTATPQPDETAQPTVTPEPSVMPEPDATVTPDPDATVTPEPDATPTPEPSVTPEPCYEQLTYGLPGLARDLTPAELAHKRSLAATPLIAALSTLRAGVHYEPGVVLLPTSSRAYAEEVAAAYGAQVASLSGGLAVLAVADPVAAVRAASDEAALLPAVYLNQYYYFEDPSANSGERASAGATLMSADDVPSATGWADYRAGDPFLSDPTDIGHYAINASISSGYQYALAMMDVYAAWGLTEGSPSVSVAVLDSGIDDAHPELSGKVISLNANGLTDSANHGTHVAGIIAAKRDNAQGGAGVAPGVQLLSYRVTTNSNSISSASMISGLNAAKNAGAWVINMSLGGFLYDPLVNEAVQNCIAAGIPVIAACGNTGGQTMQYPAQYPGVISVAAVDASGRRAPFSTYGAATLAAPGAAILSTRRSGGYLSQNGTSMATPMVSGVAALYYSAMGTRDLDRNGVVNAADVAVLTDALKSCCTKPTGSGSGLGAGIINAGELLGDIVVPPAISLRTAADAPYDGPRNAVPSDALVCITPGENGACIIYTTDGSAPAVRGGSIANGTRADGRTLLSIAHLPAGRVTVKALSVNAQGRKSAVRSYSFTINNTVATSVSVSGSAYVGVGKTVPLTAAAVPVSTMLKPTWALTDTALATITAGGRVTARAAAKPGDVITAVASIGDVRCEHSLTVISPVQKILLYAQGEAVNGKALTVAIGSKLHITPQAVLADGTTLSGVAAPGYTVSPGQSNRLLVGQDGNALVITPLRKGSTKLYVSALDGSGRKAQLTVQAVQPVASLSLQGNTTAAARGHSVRLKAALTPSNATDQGVVWSVEESPAGISLGADGRLTVAKNAPTGSTVRVRCTSRQNPDIFDEHTLTITDPVRSVVLDSADPKVIRNKTGKLSGGKLFTHAMEGTEYDAQGPHDETRLQLTAQLQGCAESDLRWTTSNSKVALVDEETGLVTAVAPGNVTITCTATDGTGKAASVKLRVVRPASSLSIAPSRLGNVNSYSTLGFGKTLTLKPVFGSERGTPTDKKVVWSYEVRHYNGYGYVSNMNDPSAYTVVTDTAITSRIVLTQNGRLTLRSSLGDVLYGSGEWFVTVRATAADGSGVTATHNVLPARPTTRLKAMTGTFTIYDGSLLSMQLTTASTLKMGSSCYLWFASDMDLGNVGVTLFDLTAQTSAIKVASPIKLLTSASIFGSERYVKIGGSYYPLYAVQIKPDGVGRAVISLKTNDGTGLSCSFNIRVTQ